MAPSLPLRLFGLSPTGKAVNITDCDRCEIDSHFSRHLSQGTDYSLRVNPHARYSSIDAIRHHACLDHIDSWRHAESHALTVVTGHRDIQDLQPRPLNLKLTVE